MSFLHSWKYIKFHRLKHDTFPVNIYLSSHVLFSLQTIELLDLISYNLQVDNILKEKEKENIWGVLFLTQNSLDRIRIPV